MQEKVSQQIEECLLTCIKCDKKLEAVMPETPHQPYGGTLFWSPGHYGSTIHDPMDGSEIMILLCDECLHEASQNNKVLQETKPSTPEDINSEFDYVELDSPPKENIPGITEN